MRFYHYFSMLVWFGVIGLFTGCSSLENIQLGEQEPSDSNLPGKADNPVETCLFGADMWEFENNPYFQNGTPLWVNIEAATDLSESRKHQLVKGMQIFDFDETITDLQTAIDWTDDSELEMTEMTAGNGVRYIESTFSRGDTPLGFIFADAEVVQVDIHDDWIYTCRVLKPDGTCLFGEEMSAFEDLSDLSLGEEITFSLADEDSLSVIRKQQVILGMRLMDETINTFKEAIESADDEEMILQSIKTSDGQQFVLYRYWGGENPYGFIFADGEVVFAIFSDGFTEECQVQAPKSI